MKSKINEFADDEITEKTIIPLTKVIPTKRSLGEIFRLQTEEFLNQFINAKGITFDSKEFDPSKPLDIDEMLVEIDAVLIED